MISSDIVTRDVGDSGLLNTLDDAAGRTANNSDGVQSGNVIDWESKGMSRSGLASRKAGGDQWWVPHRFAANGPPKILSVGVQQ
jgi:hypothetical protein